MTETIIVFTALYVFSMSLNGLLMTMREFYQPGHSGLQPLNRSRHGERRTRGVGHALVPGYSGA